MKNNPSQTRIKPLTWPPTLYESYRGLIARDWHEGNLVVPSSMADHASAHLIPQGPWTAWTSVKTTPEISIKASLTKTLGPVGMDFSEPESGKSIFTQDDPAVQRVSNYLELLKGVDGGAKQPSIKQLSRRVGLPLATVCRVLKKLDLKLDGSS